MSSRRPPNAIDFTVKQTVAPDGTVTNEVEIKPEDIKACLDSGMSPEESAAYFRELSRINNELHSSKPLQDPAENKTAQSTAKSNETRTKKGNPAANSAKHSLSEIIERYYDDLKIVKYGEDWKPSNKHTTFFRRLIEITGDKAISEITRDDAKQVLKQLKLLPANTAKYRGMTVDKIISLNIDEEKFTTKTINDHMEMYSRLFKWIVSEYKEYTDNPFVELRVQANKKIKQNQRRQSFTSQDLVRIFSTELYTNGQYDSVYKFWTPLIALYTGARNAEIAALYKEDIKQIDNNWVFDFNENTKDKRLKSANSFRKTPIHPHLIEIGFIDFVESCNDNHRLFQELSNWTTKDGYSRPIGDWFNREYLVKLGIYIKTKKVFYSFRHTMTSALDRAGVMDYITEQICGREAGNNTLGRENYADDVSVARLLTEIIKVDFRNELSNVRWIPK